MTGVAGDAVQLEGVAGERIVSDAVASSTKTFSPSWSGCFRFWPRGT